MGELRSPRGVWLVRVQVNTGPAKFAARRALRLYWYYNTARQVGLDRRDSLLYAQHKMIMTREVDPSGD
jgi:hypothetical protein